MYFVHYLRHTQTTTAPGRCQGYTNSAITRFDTIVVLAETQYPPLPYNSGTMLRLALALVALLGLALAACGGDEEAADHAVDLGPTLTTGYAGNVSICPRVGVPGEATPATQTPVPACKPGANLETVPGVRTAIAQPPALPLGAGALTNYIEFTIDHPGTAAVVAIPLDTTVPIGRTLTWYTYENGVWHALDAAVTVHESTIAGQDALAEASFESLPANLILLAEN